MKKSSAIHVVLKLKLFAVLVLLLLFTNASAQRVEHYNSPLYSPRTYDPNDNVTSNGLPPTLKNVGIEQKLNEQLPLDAVFKNEDGREVKLGEYFGKGRPVILALVYYECPMLCTMELNGLVKALRAITRFQPGQDFEIVTVSINPRETPLLAEKKKQSYLKMYGKQDAGQK